MPYRVLSALFVFAFIASSCRAGDACEVLYVAKGHVNPVNDGSSWANAFCNNTALADAIAAAAARMDGPNPPACIDIYVAAGIYKPSDSGASFAMHDKVHLYGGFKVGDGFSMRQTGCMGGDNDGRPCETAADCPGGTCDLERATIISGDINDDDGAPCVVDPDCGGGMNQCVGGQCLIWPNFGPMVTYNQEGACTLDGFVLKSAYASLGSAVRIVGAPDVCPPIGPTLRHCLIRNNYTGPSFPQGGAVSNEYAGTIIDHCFFGNNEAYDDGAALRSRANHLQIMDSFFENNSITGPASGGAVFLGYLISPACSGHARTTFTGCAFTGNAAGEGSGGAVSSGDEVTFLDCEFHGNSSRYAGTIDAWSSVDQVLVDGCDFVENTGGHTGAIEAYNLIVRNSTFYRNIGEVAGAISIEGYLVTEGSRFFNNSGDAAGAIFVVGVVNIRDSIFAGNHWVGRNYLSLAGAALQAYGGELRCERCRFIGNTGNTGTVTLGFVEATFIDSLFAGNNAPAVSLETYSTMATLINSTLAKNSALGELATLSTAHAFLENGTLTVEVRNSILWDNSDSDSSLECTDQIDCRQTCDCATCASNSPCFACNPQISVEVSLSDIEHPFCVWPGAGNINEDPMFVRDDVPRDCDGNGWGDPQCAAGPCTPGVTGCDDYGDFRLRPGSPAINAGDPNAEDLPATDLDGNPRLVGCPDMGAYEFAGGGDCCEDEDCGQTEICCVNVCAPDIDSDADTVPDCLDLCPTADDRIDADQNGTPDCAQFQPIPAVSTWGLAILALLLLIAAKAHSRRPRLA